MTVAQQIYVLGDIHGDWGSLNAFINKNIRHSKQIAELKAQYDELEAVILQVGDFGYWPHRNSININNSVDGIKGNRVKIFWCDGNHENHDVLDELQAGQPDKPFIEICPSVYFATFGSMLTLIDGTTVMFCGGADSIDKHFRIPRVSWWKQEVIDDADMAKLPPQGTKVDWIVSHTCPKVFNLRLQDDFLANKETDPSKSYLDKIFKAFTPSRWWFGHYH
ncbi:MAG: metallophosphoesterase, partial [Desulfovibrio sp.]|nr:metallophosphoesterase [Desulfovibrio sp.]